MHSKAAIMTLAGALVGAACPALGQANDPTLCARVADDKSRLECFDLVFPRGPTETPTLVQPPPTASTTMPVRRVRTERITGIEPQPGR